MNQILSSLYNCAMSAGDDPYLIGDDAQYLRSAVRGKEHLGQELQERLDDEQLALLERYIDQSSDVSGWEHIAAFRKGLSMGLKLGAFCISER